MLDNKQNGTYFGNTSNTQNSQSNTSAGFFGTTSTSQTPQPNISTGLFGTTPTTPGALNTTSTGLFGGSSGAALSQTKPLGGLFSVSQNLQQTSTDGLFGSFNTKTSQSTTGGGLFGSSTTPSNNPGTSTQSLFSNMNTTSGPSFGSGNSGGLFTTTSTDANPTLAFNTTTTGSLGNSGVTTNNSTTGVSYEACIAKTCNGILGLFSGTPATSQNNSSNLFGSSNFMTTPNTSTLQVPKTDLFSLTSTGSAPASNLPSNSFSLNPSTSTATTNTNPLSTTGQINFSSSSLPGGTTSTNASLCSNIFSNVPSTSESKTPLTSVPSCTTNEPTTKPGMSVFSTDSIFSKSASQLNTTASVLSTQSKEKNINEGAVGNLTDSKSSEKNQTDLQASSQALTSLENSKAAANQGASSDKISEPTSISNLSNKSQAWMPSTSSSLTENKTGDVHKDSSKSSLPVSATTNKLSTETIGEIDSTKSGLHQSITSSNTATSLFGKSVEPSKTTVTESGKEAQTALASLKSNEGGTKLEAKETTKSGAPALTITHEANSESKTAKNIVNFACETLDEYQYERIDGLLSQWDQRVKRQLADFQKYAKVVTTLDLDLCNSVATLEIVEKNQLTIEQKLCEIDLSLDQIESQQISLGECLEKIQNVLLSNMQETESKHPLKGRLQTVSTSLDDAEAVLDQITKDVNTIQEAVHPGPLGDIITMLNLHQRSLDTMTEEAQQLRDSLAQIGRYDATLA